MIDDDRTKAAKAGLLSLKNIATLFGAQAAGRAAVVMAIADNCADHTVFGPAVRAIIAPNESLNGSLLFCAGSCNSRPTEIDARVNGNALTLEISRRLDIQTIDNTVSCTAKSERNGIRIDVCEWDKHLATHLSGPELSYVESLITPYFAADFFYFPLHRRFYFPAMSTRDMKAKILTPKHGFLPKQAAAAIKMLRHDIKLGYTPPSDMLASMMLNMHTDMKYFQELISLDAVRNAY